MPPPFIIYTFDKTLSTWPLLEHPHPTMREPTTLGGRESTRGKLQ